MLNARRRPRVELLFPEERIIDLPGLQQVFQLLQARKGAKVEDLRRHINPSEKFKELLSSAPGIPLALKAWKMLPDFLEGNAVTAIVRTRWPEGKLAIGENLRDGFGDLSHSVVV